MATQKNRWAVAEAKASLSEVIDRAMNKGPQVITRRGKKAVVVVSVQEWERKTKQAGTLADFFLASPLRGSGLVLERVKDHPREVTFEVPR